MHRFKIDKEKLADYFILVVRCLLAYIFLDYGYAKLTEGQFGLHAEELAQPLGKTSLMRMAWYLFSFQPFKYFIGISQIICALLLIWNRTVLLGAALFLPIAANILIIDLTIMPGSPFAMRLSFYLLLDLLIFYHYREKVIMAFFYLTKGINPKFKYKPGWYLAIPLFAILLEFLPFVPRMISAFLKDPQGTWHEILKIIEAIGRNI